MGEVAVFYHARHFHDALELDFAPASTDLRSAESFDKIGSFRLQLDLCGGQGFDLLNESAVGGEAFFFDFPDSSVHFEEGFVNGFDELGDGLLAFFQIVAGGFLMVLPGGLGQIEEGLVVVLEGFCREGFEGIAQLLAGFLEELEFFGGSLAFFIEFGLEAGLGGAGFGEGLAQGALFIAQGVGFLLEGGGAFFEDGLFGAEADFQIVPLDAGSPEHEQTAQRGSQKNPDKQGIGGEIHNGPKSCMKANLANPGSGCKISVSVMWIGAQRALPGISAVC